MDTGLARSHTRAQLENLQVLAVVVKTPCLPYYTWGGGMHYGGSDFRAVVPITGKPRMGTASFSRSTLPNTLPNNPCPSACSPPSSASVTEWYNSLVPLFFEEGGWSRWSRIPTFIRVTRPRSIEPAKLIGIRKRISGSSHHVLPQSGLICICSSLQRPVIRPEKPWVKKGITPILRMLLFLNIAVDATPIHDAAKVVAKEDEATI
ncbi:hypothetical protein F4814DRAFT_285077 [Daldinia grandis]|nr:hypothetical protein F4814DRAFT_285077 [Daldinia grandis]